MTDVVHIEAVDARARGLRTRRAGDRFGPLDVVRRLDALLLFAVFGALAYGLVSVVSFPAISPAMNVPCPFVSRFRRFGA